ncbi:hypothetical protein BH09VER1_BH09VER1_51710 [soil metagenome]
MKWLKLTLATFLSLLICAVFGVTYLATHVTRVQAPEKSDFLVVLGGDTADRAPVAARLFREGWAPKVLISGFPDECRDNARVLMESGVPASAILFDEKSTTTQTNGVYSAAILKNAGAQRVILVTSWYHSGRSVRIFRKYLPVAIKIISVPSATPQKWTRQWYESVRSEVIKSMRDWWNFGIPLTIN